MNRYFMQAVCACLFFLVLTATARAEMVFCVSNASQLAQALTQASASNDSPIYIRLRSGTYQATAQTGSFMLLAQHSDQFVEVSGGWSGTGSTCVTRSPNPANTTLLGTTTRPAFSVIAGLNMINPNTSVTSSTVHVLGLTLKNSNFTSPYEIDEDTFDEGYWDDRYRTTSGCLNAYLAGPSNAMKLERLDSRDCISPNNGDASGRIENSSGTLNMNNIVVRGGSAKVNGGMRILTSHNGISRLTQFTVINTTFTHGAFSNMSGLDLRAYYGGTAYLSNSVLYGNKDTDWPANAVVDLNVISARWNYDDHYYQTGSAGTVRLNRVHYGMYDQIAPAGTVISQGITVGDPGFISAGPYLKSDSPLVDSGIVNPPGGAGPFDAAGKTRVQGARVDVGAFEVTPTNQAPNLGNGSIQISSSTAVGTLLHTFVATDDGLPAPGTLVYSIQSVQAPSGQGNPFALATNGRLTLTSALPAGQAGTYLITARVCDAGALCDTGTLTVNVVAQPPASGAIFSNGFED